MKHTPQELLNSFIENRNRTDIDTLNTKMTPRVIAFDEQKQSVKLGFPIREWQLNPLNNIHGGIIATAADSTMGCLPYIFSEGHDGPTIQMSLNYVAPAAAGDELIVEAAVDHLGHRISQTHCTVYSRDTGRVVATAHASFLVSGKSAD